MHDEGNEDICTVDDTKQGISGSDSNIVEMEEDEIILFGDDETPTGK